jgi:hypothetical protein
MGQGPYSLSTVNSPISAATVTETAILRSQVADLLATVEKQGAQLAEQSEQIRKLRLQVQALRGGARLAEEP